MEESLLWELQNEPASSQSPLGRVIHTLLSSRPRHLEAAVSRAGAPPSRSSCGALLDESLCFLWRYVEDAAKKEESLDEILIPIIEQFLMFKGPKHNKQVMTLIGWLFQDVLLSCAISSNLIGVLKRKEDHYIALGWCKLVTVLIEYILNHFFGKGNQQQQGTLLNILCQSIPDLSSLACGGSTFTGGFELPTRLSVAAADCILVLTEALTKLEPLSEVSISGRKANELKYGNQLETLIPARNSKKNNDSTFRSSQGLIDLELGWLLWDYLDELIVLVHKLQEWSKKSRPLHAKGLEQVLKWLKEIKLHYGTLEKETGNMLLRSGMLLVSSCWKHYALLLRLDDHRFIQNHGEMLDQYLSAVQFYTQNTEDNGDTSSSIETRKFFLNCIVLLWGRLHGKQLEITISQNGHRLLTLLFSQLQCNDEDLIEEAVSILRSIFFMGNLSRGSSSLDIHLIEMVLPLLLNLLDERDSTTRAVVKLTAEYCYLNPDRQGLQEIFRRLEKGNYCQKRNALDVISEIIHLDAEKKISPSIRKNIGEILLDCLGDEELSTHVKEVSNLITQLDPPSILPALVRLVYSENEIMSSSASNSLVVMLRCHNMDFNVISLLLDSLSNLSETPKFPQKPDTTEASTSGSSVLLQIGSNVDVDRILSLTPKWTETIQNWGPIIDQLIEKMFREPSNATIVRFMSYISDHLVNAADQVLHRVLLYMQGQNNVDKHWFSDRKEGAFTSEDVAKIKDSLFNRLCPLLIIRMLPLRVFDDLGSSTLYGHTCNPVNQNGDMDLLNSACDCIAALLVDRAFSLFEYEDVRKLAAELCGRLHPLVLLPIIGSQLDNAVQHRDMLKIKACLFALCTSIVARGRKSAFHTDAARIRNIIDIVLFWPSVESDEVSKAQHGCIDCLALMICAEGQDSGSSESTSTEINIIGEAKEHPENDSRSSVLTNVIWKLTCDKASHFRGSNENIGNVENPTLGETCGLLSNSSIQVPFRLCMANVLISACQKVSDSSKSFFASITLPALIFAVEEITISEVRAACLQVLFSAVYHLKSLVLPFSTDLLKLSIKALKDGSEKEKIAAAKLLASLMASEDKIVDSIAAGLLEAKSVLAHISSRAASPELRMLCKKLLACVTYPV